MSTPEPLAPNSSFWLARFLHATVAKVLLALFRVRVLGAENLPAAGGAILAGNHVSYGDPVLLWCSVPREVHFMAKSDLWNVRFLAWVVPRLRAFPVRRGKSDREALSIAGKLLERGDLVGIFPEGTRNRAGDAEAQGGVAFVAMRAGVPVIPVGIHGTDRIRPAGSRLLRFPRVTISYGEPITAEMFEGGRKEKVDAMTAEIMVRIAAALKRAEGA